MNNATALAAAPEGVKEVEEVKRGRRRAESGSAEVVGPDCLFPRQTKSPPRLIHHPM
jgi:hypothetical protein